MKRRFEELNRVLHVLLFSCLFSCSSQDNNKEKAYDTVEEISFSMNRPYQENLKNDSLRNHKLYKALVKGDTLAYISISKDYLLGGGDDMFLYFALMMTDKYDYHMAYFDVYRYYSRFKNNKMFDLLADFYLLKAYFKKNKSAKNEIVTRFGVDTNEKKLQQYLYRIEGVLEKNNKLNYKHL